MSYRNGYRYSFFINFVEIFQNCTKNSKLVVRINIGLGEFENQIPPHNYVTACHFTVYLARQNKKEEVALKKYKLISNTYTNV